MNQLTRFDTDSLNRTLIGFDNIFDSFERKFANQLSNNYPPYNVMKVDDDNYVIELAVTGFTKEEIHVEVEGDQLTIKGAKPVEQDSTKVFLHRGLAQRDFTRSFSLADYIEVSGAEIYNGILHVNLHRNIPEEAKPKIIDVVEVK